MLAIEEKEARDKKVMNEKTVWALLPTHMQAVLVLAAMCMHVSVLVFLAMGSSCFEQFDVNTAFSGPPLCAPAPQTAPTRAPRALRAAHVALPLSTFHPRPHCATSDMRACAVLVPPGCYACFRGPRVGTATGRSSSNPSVGSSSRYTSPRCCCSGSTSAGSAVLSPPLLSSPMRAPVPRGHAVRCCALARPRRDAARSAPTDPAPQVRNNLAEWLNKPEGGSLGSIVDNVPGSQGVAEAYKSGSLLMRASNESLADFVTVQAVLSGQKGADDLHSVPTPIPCNIRREGGQSLVILEGMEVIPF